MGYVQTWIIAVDTLIALWFRLTTALVFSGLTCESLAPVQQSEPVWKNILRGGLETRKCQITKAQHKVPELKWRRVLSAPLTSSQVLHSTNVTTRMGPVWAHPKRQLDRTPGAETTLQVSDSSPENKRPLKVHRSATHNRSLASDQQNAELILWNTTHPCRYSILL